MCDDVYNTIPDLHQSKKVMLDFFLPPLPTTLTQKHFI